MPTKWDELPLVLTTAEAADVARTNPEYIARQCKTKRLKATKLGHEWRIGRDNLRAFLEPGYRPSDRKRPRLSIAQQRASRSRAQAAGP